MNVFSFPARFYAKAKPNSLLHDMQFLKKVISDFYTKRYN